MRGLLVINMKDENKKNILDLQYQKYLNVASTSIIIFFTYLIGIVIAVLSKQIKLDNLIIMSFVFIISVAIIGISSIFFFNALYHLENIPRIIRDL